ncbi:MAG: hypothetical protein J6D47_19015 [Peptostreptococcaceae bacterium]|nr:hypothetical protein [Peptostreptococcaceae bacterium]
MATYLAMQILKGKLNYKQVMAKFLEYKEDIDTILILEGREDLIVK